MYRIYCANGARGFFDGVSYHPYSTPWLPCDPSTPVCTFDPSTSGKDVYGMRNGWDRMLNARNIMVANGDSAKQIWITEFGAPTNGPGGVSEQDQAAILTNGFNLWQTYTWGGAMCWFSYRDKGNDPSTHKDWFGLVDNTGAKKPSNDAFVALARG